MADKVAKLVYALIFSACTSDIVTVECGEVSYISSFPQNVQLERAMPLQFHDIEGMVDFVADDSVIAGIFQQAPFIKIYSKDSAELLGTYINKGQGPDDFSVMPSNISVRQSSDGSIISLFDYHKHLYFEMNAKASVESQHEAYDTIIESPRFKNVRYIMPLNDTDTMFWYDDYQTKGFRRQLVSGSEQQSPSNLGNLESDWSDFSDNTLSMLVAYNHNTDVVAEAMTHLNQIILYSPSDSIFRKTICVGDKLSNVAAEDGYGRKKRLNAYQGIQAIKDMFALLYVGVRASDYDDGKHGAQLQFISSDGKPLLCVNIPIPVNTFFIDSAGRLYVFSYMEETEAMYVYDIDEVKRLLE